MFSFVVTLWIQSNNWDSHRWFMWKHWQSRITGVLPPLSHSANSRTHVATCLQACNAINRPPGLLGNLTVDIKVGECSNATNKTKLQTLFFTVRLSFCTESELWASGFSSTQTNLRCRSYYKRLFIRLAWMWLVLNVFCCLSFKPST